MFRNNAGRAELLITQFGILMNVTTPFNHLGLHSSDRSIDGVCMSCRGAGAGQSESGKDTCMEGRRDRFHEFSVGVLIFRRVEREVSLRGCDLVACWPT